MMKILMMNDECIVSFLSIFAAEIGQTSKSQKFRKSNTPQYKAVFTCLVASFISLLK